MLFNSLQFILFFLIVTPVYYLLPHKFRWFHLLASSCVFYMAFVPVYILILFGTIIIDYFAGILIAKTDRKKRKYYLIISLIANIGVLFVFKYYNFFIDNINDISGVNLPFLKILLPIGLSFHTFQAMSYTIEVYRGNQKAEKHFGIYALYVMFYPQLVAGPIERPQNILHQFHKKKYFSYANIVNGLKLIAWGMFKKVVVADRLAIYVNEVFDHQLNYEGIPVIIACVFFSLQIYFDFSAYSDIAIGTAKTLGFDLMINFRMPYFSRTITEFWSRWHISLSTWFRDYLYIPLGGNRISKTRTKINQFIVFIVSGFWHGANWTFLFWGFLHGLYVIVESELKTIIGTFKLYLPVKRILIFGLITFAWIFFRAENIKQAFNIVGSLENNLFQQISNIISNTEFARLKLLYANKGSGVFLLSLIFVSTVMFIEWKQKDRSIIHYFHSLSKPVRYAMYFFLIYGSIFFGVFKKNQFIYFQF
ncbi:MAG: MBOAT family protein [Bacteroidetes bacterium]|nr:MBOAT family protein [Bacteroidota bacterium]